MTECSKFPLAYPLSKDAQKTRQRWRVFPLSLDFLILIHQGDDVFTNLT